MMKNKNRMWNAKNPNQGNHLKVLALCSAGLLRSPTLAWVLSNTPFNCNTRAAGTSQSFALVPVDEVLLEWADVVVCVHMDNFHELTEQFELDDTKTFVVLNTPDDYGFRDPELVKQLTAQVTMKFKDLGLL